MFSFRHSKKMLSFFLVLWFLFFMCGCSRIMDMLKSPVRCAGEPECLAKINDVQDSFGKFGVIGTVLGTVFSLAVGGLYYKDLFEKKKG